MRQGEVGHLVVFNGNRILYGIFVKTGSRLVCTSRRKRAGRVINHFYWLQGTCGVGNSNLHIFTASLIYTRYI